MLSACPRIGVDFGNINGTGEFNYESLRDKANPKESR